MWRYKKRELLYFWVDYIKAFIEVGASNILKSLSVNSNQYFFKYWNFDFTILKVDISEKFKYYFNIIHNNINIWFIGLWWSEKKDFIEITGQGLTLFWVDLYYYIMELLNIKFVKYKRFDLCFDLELDINYFHNEILNEKFKDEKQNYTTIKTIKNWIETIYLWKKNIKQNSYILNRIYNKVADSIAKDKLFLYADKYKNKDGFYKQVTRFESEIREDLAKFYDFEAFKDINLLYYRIVKSFYKYNWQFFKFLKTEDFEKFAKQYELKNKITLENIKSWNVFKANTLYQERVLKIKEAKERQEKFWNDFINKESEEICVKTFISYWKKLFKNGFSLEKLTKILENHINL